MKTRLYMWLQKLKMLKFWKTWLSTFRKGYCEIRQRHSFEDKDQQKGPTLPPFSWSVTASANFKFVHHFLQPKARILFSFDRYKLKWLLWNMANISYKLQISVAFCSCNQFGECPTILQIVLVLFLTLV